MGKQIPLFYAERIVTVKRVKNNLNGLVKKKCFESIKKTENTFVCSVVKCTHLKLGQLFSRYGITIWYVVFVDFNISPFSLQPTII